MHNQSRPFKGFNPGFVCPSALLFDHDGVLVESEPFHWRAWQHLTKEIGFEVPESWLKKIVGKTSPEILARYLAEFKPNLQTSEPQQTTWVDRKNALYLEFLKEGVRAYPGVTDLIQWARGENLRLAVVSNARSRELHSALTQLGLVAHFDEVLSREDVPAPKPSPLAYLAASEMIRTTPSKCLVIEDSPTGLEAALMAQIPCAAVASNYSFEELQNPVPGRPDLSPIWIGPSVVALFEDLKTLPKVPQN